MNNTTLFISKRHNDHLKGSVGLNKMSTFNIDDEIDKLVNKLGETLKLRLKKSVVRSEKMVLKQYIASQKTTGKVPIIVKTTSSSSSSSKGHKNKQTPVVNQPKRVRKKVYVREPDITGSESGSEESSE
jgi:hypothetical protein